MKPLAVLLVLLSAVMHAPRNDYNKRAIDKQAFVWWFEVFGLLFFTPVALGALAHGGAGRGISWTWVLMSGGIHFLYWYLLTRALDSGDLSLVYPIMRSSPALVLVISVAVLGEAVTVTGAAGILLVALGVYTINLEGLNPRELLRPLSALRRDRSVRYAFLTPDLRGRVHPGGQGGSGPYGPGALRLCLSCVQPVALDIYLFRAKPAGTLKNNRLLCSYTLSYCL